MEELTIKIHKGEEGWYFDIYDVEETEEVDSLDGGLCTGTLEDALGMAYEQAKELLKD